MSEPPVSLEDLLKLKRHERPQGDFWDGFERDFQRRRLRALMEGEKRDASWNLFGWRRLAFWMPVTGGATAAAVFGLGLISNTPRTSESDALQPLLAEVDQGAAEVPVRVVMEDAPSVRPAMRSADFYASMAGVSVSRPHFVIDELATQDEARNFRRVLSSGSLRVPVSTGTRYAADPLTAGRMEASSAVLRPRSQF